LNCTKIEYLDYTWNPIVGCSGKGCAVSGACWAKGQAKRRKHVCQRCYAFEPHFHFERYGQPKQVKNPSRIGVAFMGDLFDAAFNFVAHRALFSVMEGSPQHTFVVLTKQPQNIEVELQIPKNVWLGVSVNCRADLWRIAELKSKLNVKLKFVSFEPLYEDVTYWHQEDIVYTLDLSGIDWVIIGAQRRPTVLPKRVWVLNLEKAARAAGAKIFRKNNLADRFSVLQELPEVKS
jgi:protein gp37